MILNYAEFKDKVYACWIGKNIGGTMGTPYEGQRQMQDIQGFVTKAGEVLPNDDLDLQLVWLLALEQIGPYNVNAATLGEYWVSFITPHWNEYGICKANMKRGLRAPLSGDYNNHWKNSNGAWIRTEIWASVAPGLPAAAAKYAIEDAKVDHGAGEGTYAAAFVAAMQSAAFVISDIRKCIEIGLAAIPDDSRMAKSIKFVFECYDKGMTYADTRNAVQQLNSDIGDGWFEAPSNVSYAVIGLLWGNGDFKKSMIYAINCGDDTDCTGATVGATLGILLGTAGIPEDWKEHLGDDIVTISVARGNVARHLPNNCKALTERVVAIAPSVLFANRQFGYIKISECGNTNIPENALDILFDGAREANKEFSRLKPYMTHFESVLFNVDVTLPNGADIEPNGSLPVSVEIINNIHHWNSSRFRTEHENAPQNLSLRWIVPEGFAVEGGKRAVYLDEGSPHATSPSAVVNFTVKAGEKLEAANRLVLEIVPEGRPTAVYVPVMLLG